MTGPFPFWGIIDVPNQTTVNKVYYKSWFHWNLASFLNIVKWGRLIWVRRSISEGRNWEWFSNKWKKWWKLNALTANTHAISPGFSLWSTWTHSRIRAPMYQGMAPKRKPMINLANKVKLIKVYKYTTKKKTKKDSKGKKISLIATQEVLPNNQLFQFF